MASPATRAIAPNTTLFFALDHFFARRNVRYQGVEQQAPVEICISASSGEREEFLPCVSIDGQHGSLRPRAKVAVGNFGGDTLSVQRPDGPA